MGQEPTVEPLPGRDDPTSEPAHFDAGAEEAAGLAAGCHADNSADTGNDGGPKVFVAAPDDHTGASTHSTLSSVAAAMTGDLAIFLLILGRAIDADIFPAARRSLHRGGAPTFDEGAALERLVAVAIAVAVEEAKPSAAATICAALAARTVARSLLRTEGVIGMADGEALLAAWLDAARAVAAARGCDGLRRLLPTARHLARRTAGRGEPAAEIATTMRRVAARIAADPSLGRVLNNKPPEGREHDRMLRGMSDLPRRIAT